MTVTGICVREVGAVPAAVFHDVDISPWHDFGWENGVRSNTGGNSEKLGGSTDEAKHDAAAVQNNNPGRGYRSPATDSRGRTCTTLSKLDADCRYCRFHDDRTN